MIRNQGDEDGSESPTKQQHGGSPVKTVMSKFQRGSKGGKQFKAGKGASMKVFIDWSFITALVLLNTFLPYSEIDKQIYQYCNFVGSRIKGKRSYCDISKNN